MSKRKLYGIRPAQGHPWVLNEKNKETPHNNAGCTWPQNNIIQRYIEIAVPVYFNAFLACFYGTPAVNKNISKPNGFGFKRFQYNILVHETQG